MRQKTVEEYIEVIYALEIADGRALTGRIASEMKVKPSSVTEMLQKLQREELLDYETYAGATLTSAGRRLAQDLERKRSAIADFLKILGVEKEVAKQDACQMEHHVSRETIDRMSMFAEFASLCKRDPTWMECFRKFCESGELVACNFCGRDDDDTDMRSESGE
jgi:DtxR family transcriptional regulator, Mn-dependent transcriptional regulator